MTVVVWVECGGRDGDDRGARMLGIVEALRRRLVGVQLVADAAAVQRGWVRGAGAVGVRVIAPGEDGLCVVREQARDADAIIIDTASSLSGMEVDGLRRRWPLLLVDHAGDGVERADLVLAPGAVHRDVRWLTDPSFVPLRRALAPLGVRHVGPGGVPSVLVHLSRGVFDTEDLGTLAAVDALGRLVSPRVTAQVIAEPATAIWTALPARLGRLGFAPAQPVSADGLASHLATADVALVRAGMPMYEALVAGVPAVVVSRSAAEVAMVEALAEHGALVSLGLAPSIEQVAGAVAALAGDRRLRFAMTRAARRVIDGRGASRVVDRWMRIVDGAAVDHVDL